MPLVSPVVLFDIDGTLVQTSRAGVRGMNAAFAELHGRVDALDGVPIAGRTDRAIVSDAFRATGLEPTAEAITALRDAYVRHLAVEIRRPATSAFGVLPGVLALLDQMAAARPKVPVGLLTGNFEQGAAVKLGHFDLWRRFPFGAFGDDHLDRRDLVPVACDRGRAAGLEMTPTRMVIIGDTPLDVDCAHAHGAVAVAVATGLYSAAALCDAGADLVVETLEALAADAEWIERVTAGVR
jgi:phosphoglycolate phosphatase-like HAD superfamily hydrolase